MEEKIEMLESLLELYPYSIAEGDVEQFNIWVKRVTIGLKSAGMVDELKLWEKAIHDSHYSDSHSSIDPTLILQTESMKAVLLGIYSNLIGKYGSEELFPLDIVNDTRPYIVSIAKQANTCFQLGLYDSSAVMMRRMIEQLIIDCYENRGLKSEIENEDGSYFGLGKLIDAFISESWHKPKLLIKYLPDLKHLKELGDNGAHGRNITNQKMIVHYSKAISYTFQGLVHLAKYK